MVRLFDVLFDGIAQSCQSGQRKHLRIVDDVDPAHQLRQFAATTLDDFLVDKSVQHGSILAVKGRIVREADHQGHQFGSVAPNRWFFEFGFDADVTIGSQNADQHVQVIFQWEDIDEGQATGGTEDQAVQGLQTVGARGRIFAVQ